MYKILALVLVLGTISNVLAFKPTKAPKPAPQPPHVGRPPRSPRCQGEFEEYVCRHHQETCDNQPKENREIKNGGSQSCTNACYCIKGYARDSQGKCIPRRECPNQSETLLLDTPVAVQFHKGHVQVHF